MSQLHVPSHLSEGARNWIDAIREDRDWTLSQWRLVQLAAEAWDRSQTARRTLAREGMTLVIWAHDESGERYATSAKAHPAVPIVRDNAQLFAKLLGQLGLDREVVPEAPAVPAPPMAGQTNIIDELAARRGS